MPPLQTHGASVRLFANETLERLTFMHPRIFALAWALMLPMIACYGWMSTRALGGGPDLSAVFGYIGIGLLAWTLFEYAMHRFLFHWETNFAPLRWLVYVMHGNHHDSPNDRLRGLMPLPVSISIGGLVWLACLALIGVYGTWVFFGFMIGYVAYDTVHYGCHHWKTRHRLFAPIRHHHMRHHFSDARKNFATTCPFWDRLLGTCSKPSRQRRREIKS